MKKYLILSILSVALVMQLQAQTFRMGNLKFTVTSKVAHKVAAAGFLQQGEGELNIPKTVQYNDETYTVTSIADEAFQYCTYSSLVLPNTLTTIGKSAFWHCKYLSGDLIIPSSVKTIGKSAFEGCINLNTVKLPESIETINPRVFYGCSRLSGRLVIPNSVTDIGNSAFEGCEKITGLSLGENVKSIGEQAFWRCGISEGLIIGNSVEYIGNSAFKSNPIPSLVIQNPVKVIGAEAFAECKKLSGELCIPSTVTQIGYRAFYSTDISILSIMSSPEIDTWAFAYCYKLQEVKCYSMIPPRLIRGAFNVFEGSNRFTIAVPAGRLSAYKSSAWGGLNLDIFDDLAN